MALNDDCIISIFINIPQISLPPPPISPNKVTSTPPQPTSPNKVTKKVMKFRRPQQLTSQEYNSQKYNCQLCELTENTDFKRITRNTRIKQYIVLPYCKHTLCSDCHSKLIQVRNRKCPFCRKSII